MALILLTPAAVEPVLLADAKVHCRVEPAMVDDDDLITALIIAAREYAETYTHRVFITQQWRQTLDYFPSGSPFTTIDSRPIDGNYELLYRNRTVDSKDLQPKDQILLPKPSLLSVESIKSIGLDGIQVTMDPATYDVEVGTLPGRITLGYLQAWPLTRNQRNCVTIDFTAGYGADGTFVPGAIKAAIKLLIGHWYENREAVILSRYSVAEVPLTVDALLAAHQVVEFQ